MAKIFKHRTDVPYFDYKDVKTLQRYVNGYGQIETRKKTGLTESQQRRLAVAIKRARHIALLPFVTANQEQIVALSITNLKKGTVFQWEGEPYRVVDYNQKVMGRGGSIVNVRIKSLIDGKVLEKTFKGNETLDSADVSTQPVQFLYADGATFYFMNEATFNQFEVPADLVGDNAGYLKEGDKVQLQFFDDRPISVELPKNLPLKVIYTEDAVKGDTSSAITKDATLETGITIKVPAFIKQGDIISVDTSSGSYRERVKDQLKKEDLSAKSIQLSYE